MSKQNKLIILKVFHTLCWIFLIFLISYIWYAGIFNIITDSVWFAVIGVMIEGLILLFNGGMCPLTKVAFKYTNDREPGFDIYLPKWLAKYNIPLFTIISILGFLLVIFRVITR